MFANIRPKTDKKLLMGKDVEKNAVHGSDGPETAAWEIAFFFKPDEIHSCQ